MIFLDVYSARLLVVATIQTNLSLDNWGWSGALLSGSGAVSIENLDECTSAKRRREEERKLYGKFETEERQKRERG